MVNLWLCQIAKILANCVGCALKPVFSIAAKGLLGCQKLHEATVENIEVVRTSNMPVETYRHELRQNVNLVEATVKAVRKWNIDKSIFSGQRHGWFGTIQSERLQSRATPSAKDYGDDVLHDVTDLG
jgi:hypothetical protein